MKSAVVVKKAARAAWVGIMHDGCKQVSLKVTKEDIQVQLRTHSHGVVTFSFTESQLATHWKGLRRFFAAAFEKYRRAES